MEIKEELIELKRRINVLEKKLVVEDKIVVTCLEKYHAYFHHDKISPKKAFENLMEILKKYPLVNL